MGGGYLCVVFVFDFVNFVVCLCFLSVFLWCFGLVVASVWGVACAVTNGWWSVGLLVDDLR